MAIPKGAVPTYALHGRPAYEARLAHIENARIAAPSAEYIGRGNKCSANDDTCEGARAKGTEFCVGHLRSAIKNKEVVDGTDETDEG
jgi:hypothetical protein